MNTFPIFALSRPYTLGTPSWRPIESGVAALQLGNGTLRTRAELGQPIWAIDLQLDALTAADKAILDAFYLAHRAGTFYFPHTDFTTYTCRFDSQSPPQIVPSREMTARYDATIVLLLVVPTATTDMLVAHWKLNDDAADTDVVDATGNGHTGTASANTSTLTVTGKIDAGLEFITASSRYVGVTDHADLRLTGGGTVCFWVKWDGTRESSGGASVTIVSRGTNGWRIWMATAAGAVGFITTTGPGNQAITTAAALVSGTWRHISVVWGAEGTRRIYVDAVDATAENGDGSVPGSAAGDVHIGAYTPTSGFFGGVLDDVRIYQRPLTALEIAAIYNAGSGTEETIVA